MRALLLLSICLTVGAAAVYARAPSRRTPTRPICPYTEAIATDGCVLGRVPGIPNNPTLLLPYGSKRPPWNVAGVDYRVGHSGPLRNPATGGLPACASYAAGAENKLTIDSAPCTIDHYDFSLNTGVCLHVSSAVTNGAAISITNNNFKDGATCQPAGGGLVNFPAGMLANVTIRYNTFDVAYNNNFSNILNMHGDGDRTIEYNVFLHADQHDIAFQKSGDYVVRYNYAFGTGCCGNHGDWLIFNNGTGTTFSLNEQFNTVTQDRFVAGAAAGATAFCYLATFGSLTFTSGKCNNDTYISRLGDDGLSHVSFPIRVEPAGTWSPGPFEVKDNYIDFSGSIDSIEATDASGSATVTCSGNKDLSTGNAITGAFDFLTCN